MNVPMMLYRTALLSRFAFLAAAVLAPACGGGAKGGAAQSTQPGGAGAPTGGDVFATQKTGPIAPGCAGSFCAEVDLDVKLACRDTINDVDYTQATRITGKTGELTCSSQPGKDGKTKDLRVGISPSKDAPEDVFNSNEVWFLLRNYTGPGTYPLVNVADEGSHMGFAVKGKTSGHTEDVITVGTVECVPQACEAIVAEGSDLLPTDENQTHDFRVRVEIRCPRGGQIGNMHCEPGNTRCTFSETPTLLADLVCNE